MVKGFMRRTAGRAVQAGEQVLHTYGDLSDAALLQTYGFVEDLGGVGNPHNCVRLPATRLTEVLLAALLIRKSGSWVSVVQRISSQTMGW